MIVPLLISFIVFSCTPSLRYNTSLQEEQTQSVETTDDKINQNDENPTDSTNQGTIFQENGLILHSTGKASYYGNKFNGRKTASGERFDNTKYTAAHRKLPFGTEIVVENVANKKRVTVRINDRGPFTKNRILDVSLKAAKELDFVRLGTATIRIYMKKNK